MYFGFKVNCTYCKKHAKGDAGTSECDRDRPLPLVGSFSPKKAVCTMDCALCRQMALRIRAEAGESAESPSGGSAASSVASSRKASVVPSVSIGKGEWESLG